MMKYPAGKLMKLVLQQKDTILTPHSSLTLINTVVQFYSDEPALIYTPQTFYDGFQ